MKALFTTAVLTATLGLSACTTPDPYVASQPYKPMALAPVTPAPDYLPLDEMPPWRPTPSNTQVRYCNTVAKIAVATYKVRAAGVSMVQLYRYQMARDIRPIDRMTHAVTLQIYEHPLDELDEATAYGIGETVCHDNYAYL
jgi:hypothetical protein